jgi:hypothetical protein
VPPPTPAQIDQLARQELARRKALQPTKEQQARYEAQIAAEKAADAAYYASPQYQIDKEKAAVAMLANAKRQAEVRTPLDLYGPEVRESLDNARARRIVIQSYLPDVGIERTKDAALAKAKAMADKLSDTGGDKVIKTAILASAAKVGVVRKLPILLGIVPGSIGGVVLEADPANTIEATAEERLAAAEEQLAKQIADRIRQIEQTEVLFFNPVILPVWTQDP